ncbi:tetratricopeptide repeat domain containing protein, putative [Babesia bigemina]|uniref:Tetratricopeptide repeat domain containing protein, putative n=1 Tax=Babesia bigemina TaxID=5866 RepID=A0A061D6G9_BABBI|nr:tetratricopeptide repeat domain containing protein, putative [Babesia bigemina]CDR95612.1 tetratricopeptide repeat domain containing protein, putative [Babesia bigemina]|eukprot:XP_012767798.1 tetratricopeptide repeat domain containing protein, putative [Babesia bigemina]
MATVGLDLGGFSSKVCVSWPGNDSIELHVNRLSNRETPTIVAYDKRIRCVFERGRLTGCRLYGEEADLRSTSLFNSSLCLLPYTVNLSEEPVLSLINARRYLFSLPVDEASTDLAFTVTFDDQQCAVQPRDVFAFFVNRLLDTVRKQLGVADPRANDQIQLSVPVPQYFTQDQHVAIYRALAAWGFGRIRLYKQSECLLRRWCDSHLPDVFTEFTSSTGQPKMHVAFLDVGFCHCTFFVAEVTKGDELEYRIVAEESNDAVGTYQMVEQLANFVCGSIKDKHGVDLQPPSRQAFNVYKACAKALKELSVVADVKIDCERVLADGDDFSTVLTRVDFEDMCDPLKGTLQGMMDRVLAHVEPGSLLAIETIGGGSRVPFVRLLATEAAKSLGATQVVRMSLDSTSATASGAVCLARADAPSLLEVAGAAVALEESEAKAALARDDVFSVVESEEFRKRSVLNEVDQYIIKTRNDARGAFSQQLQLDEVEPFLSALDDFALSAASDKGVSASACESQLNACRDKVRERCPAYVQALEEAEKAKAAEIERSAMAPDFSSVSEVNMDVTLPKATCLKRAAKNRLEGNALFSGGNIEMAAQHYVKALQYCSKVSGPDDEERAELDSLKLASNLNLAMCYIKMGTEASYRKAVSCCSQALELSPDNTKAIYRRAFAYDKLNELDNALADARLGVSKFPDAADLKQLLAVLEKKAKLQEDRVKKRDYSYLLKADRLARRLKAALFFAHTAARSQKARASAEDAGHASAGGTAVLRRWLPEPAGDLEAVVRTAYYCQTQLEQLHGEKDLNRKAEALKDTLKLLDSV